VTSKPITLGHEKGMVIVETEDYEVVRVFEAGKQPYLKVVGKHGGTYGQRDISKFLSVLTFDPTTFRDWSPAKQAEVFRQLAGPQWCAELDAINAEEKELAQERLLLGRLIDAAGDLATSEPESPGEDRPEREHIDRAHAELVAAEENNKRQMALRVQRKTQESIVATLRQDIAIMQRRLEEAEEALAQIPEAGPDIDTAHLEQRMDFMRCAEVEWKTWDTLHDDWQAKVDKWQKTVREHQTAEARLADVRARRLEHMANTGTISGLTMDGDELVYNDIPVSQLSTGETISLGGEIMMRMNPTIRIMFVQHGEALDDDVFEALVRMAEEHDIQLWIATVGDGHGDAIHMREGVARLVGEEVPSDQH
jgi:hypothetical protein